MLDPKKMKTSDLVHLFTNTEAMVVRAFTQSEIDDMAALPTSIIGLRVAPITQAIADEIDRRIPVPEPAAATVTTDVITLATSIIRIAEDTGHFSAILDVFQPQGCDIEKFSDTYFARRVCDGLVALAKAVIHGSVSLEEVESTLCHRTHHQRGEGCSIPDCRNYVPRPIP